MQPYVSPGALHMHTIYSHDSPGTIPDIVQAARRTGLQWVIVTDHDSLEARPFAGWHDGVLVIVGHEITPAHNHFLALDVDEVINNKKPPQDFVDEVYARGGFGIIAHPDDRIINAVKKNCYTWDDWSVDGPRDRQNRSVGLELWNLMSDWASQLNRSNKYWNFFFARQTLQGPTANTLAWWDRLNMAGKKTFGVAGVDAHAVKHRVPWGYVEVFSYRWSFQTLTNYLLLHEPLDHNADRARQQVLAALQAGQLFFANRLEGEAASLIFGIRRGKQQWTIGDTLNVQSGACKLFVDVGRNYEVRLIHNGLTRSRGKRALCECLEKPGVYRIEAYHPSGRPWLFTNPFYIIE